VYPAASLHLDGIAVTAERRGYGTASALIQAWLDSTSRAGYTHLTGPSAWSLQTNADVANVRVRRLYELFGFAISGHKHYENPRRRC